MNTIRGILEITLVVMLVIVGLVPVGAQSYKGITCNDVRALSSAERVYWSNRLNLSASQIRRIYVTCYQNHFRGHGADPNRKVVHVAQ
jgi:hypothetical protein